MAGLKRVAAVDRPGETHLIYPTARRTLCGTPRALVRGMPDRKSVV